MYLIDGVGDEVLHFFIGLLAIVIVALAWRTTNIGNHWHMHTFYLLDRSLLRRLRNHSRLTNHIEATTISESTMMTSESNENDLNTQEVTNDLDDNEDISAEDEQQESQEQSEIIETMDTNVCSIRQRRVTFYENNTCSSNSNTHTDNESTISNGTDIKKCNNDVSSASTCNTCSTETNTSNIRIKLKYINDDLKLVDGYLEEKLGDFKRRHFSEELSSNKLVKLIFNGQILERESETLQHCGLFDNCVVHCLVHQVRLSQSGENNESSNRTSTNLGSRLNSNNSNSRDWDFGNVLIVLLSFILGTAWYFRYQYPHLFTITATIALVAVTGIFTVISVGMYFPDPEPIAVRNEVH